VARRARINAAIVATLLRPEGRAMHSVVFLPEQRLLLMRLLNCAGPT
jgi:hypothetical protein